MVFTITITRKMAHEWNYELFTKKSITTELSFNSYINSSTFLSTVDITAAINLEVRRQLLTVAQSLSGAGHGKKFCLLFHSFRRLMRNLLIKMEHFDWLNSAQGVHCVFVKDLSLTSSSSFSHKSSQLQRSLY